MQDLQQTIQLVLDYIRGIWIRKRYLIICSWLICPIGFIYVASLPDVYESEAQVYVDTRSVIAPLLQGISLYNDPDSEVRMMAQTLKSRSNIEEIARESDLDITVTTDVQYEELIAELTDDIILDKTKRENIYTISYTHKNPQVARTVVQETLDVFVEGSLGGNRQDTATATRFIDEQIAEYEARLSEAEQQRAEFQRQHADILPMQGSFHTNMQNLMSELSDTKLTIREAQQKAATLRGKLTNNRKATDGLGVQSGTDAPVITTKYDQRILKLEENLDDLRIGYTDKHPDVIQTTNMLENLKKARQREIDAYLNQDDSDDAPLSQLNQDITLEISRLEGEIASLRVREEDYNLKIEDLRNKIDLVPQIEAEGIAKNRNYDIVKQKYEELLTRKEAADITKRAEITSDELQFRIIKPPLVPPEPTGPNRFIQYTGVLIVGFGLGVGLAFLMSQLTPILVRGHQLTALTGYPIWGAVTHLQIDQIKKTERFRVAVFVASTGAIIFVYAVLVAADVMNIDLLSKVIS
ncbi:XrtA system polysaccharide chain length determinant [Glaciecola petra]|uniref:Wzz/FepE/Etk N-terminal domain-containing protein n=1 Tax=Glaciecola petra TaxID=3075602 RepID=A0ABU2ZLT8_9ALTE|nr:XrtA system polysaccharide chain length determinant [Aestuariibacter sp. P117]MDT0593595.1 Wzz/FepE/Etk N-terminal domain-containing protein [Aestuariibacter sp. P117]